MVALFVHDNLGKTMILHNNPIYVKHALFPHDFPIFPQNVQMYRNSKFCRDLILSETEFVSTASNRAFHWLFDLLGVNMWFIDSGVFSLEKCGKMWKNMEVLLGGYGRTGGS